DEESKSTGAKIDGLGARIDGLGGRIDGELKAINTRMDKESEAAAARTEGLGGRIDGELRAVNIRIDSLGTRLDEMDKRDGSRFEAVMIELRSVSERIGLVKDMERLKVEVAELKAKGSGA
ncbi:MAG: hypothetical protein JRM90_07820, partial [Nitrososphaerota archaeon]|nr:hypothetical protein [Nitrososphaerota archaeon]